MLAIQRSQDCATSHATGHTVGHITAESVSDSFLKVLAAGRSPRFRSILNLTSISNPASKKYLSKLTAQFLPVFFGLQLDCFT
jgi:hypothetical protein